MLRPSEFFVSFVAFCSNCIETEGNKGNEEPPKRTERSCSLVPANNRPAYAGRSPDYRSLCEPQSGEKEKPGRSW